MNRLTRIPGSLYRQWKYRNDGWERPDVDIKDILGGEQEWDLVARSALAFLVAAGLRPHHTLLDAGCGPFRVGRLLIGYLDPDGYAGFDGSQRLLTQGREQVLQNEWELNHKRPRLEHLILDAQPLPLYDRYQKRFDFILFHEVFDVVPQTTVQAALRSIVSVMHPGTRVFATFFLNPFGDAFTGAISRAAPERKEKTIVTYPDREWRHHTPQFFERVCESIGTIRYVTCHDYSHPVEGTKMAEFRWPCA